MNDAAIGHNSNLNGDQKIKLGGYVREIERIDADVRDLTGERGAIYASAKEAGFDTKAIKHVIKMRRIEKTKREEFENAVDVYTLALGDFVTTGLGQAAVERAAADTPAQGKKRNAKPPKSDPPRPSTAEQPFAPPAADEPRRADPG